VGTWDKQFRARGTVVLSPESGQDQRLRVDPISLTAGLLHIYTETNRNKDFLYLAGAWICNAWHKSRSGAESRGQRRDTCLDRAQPLSPSKRS